MSSLSEQHDHLNPNDPAYYAPPRLRERSKSRLSPSHEPGSESLRAPISPPVPLDTDLETAVSDALWHPLQPEVIHEPDGLAREDRWAALFSIGARFAAAVGVSAVIALFFVIMVPASRQSDARSTSSEITGTVLSQPQQGHEESKPALAQFQAILGPAPVSQRATHEQSEQLLQQFLQWRQKPHATEAAQ